MKETININTTIPDSYNWYMAEAAKSACVSNGFVAVSDTTPTFVNEARTIILSKSGVPYNLVLQSDFGYSSISISIGLGIGQQVLATNFMSINLRSNANGKVLSGQIHHNLKKPPYLQLE